MSAQLNNVFNTVTPGTGPKSPVRRLRFDDHCRTAADVRASAARRRAWRDSMDPPQRPEPPAPVAPPAPPPPPHVRDYLLVAVLDLFPPAEIEPIEPDPIKVEPCSVRKIVRATAKHFGMTEAGLLEHSRKKPLPWRRWIAVYIARKLTTRSLPYIARRMTFRDHTTTMYGLNAIEKLLAAGDVSTTEAVNQIIAKLTV